MQDDLYQRQDASSGSFRFDSTVVEVFDNMIRRSVPGYGLTLEMIGVVAKRALGEASGTAYDLGCSLGSSMYPVLESTNAHVIGIDLSSAMLNEAEKILSQSFPERYTLRQENLEEIEFQDPARFICSNFTLQFLSIESRVEVLKRCYDALEEGGILLISEKFLAESSAENELLRDLHHTFKSSMGYSEMEIARKRDAIENVLIPESTETHLERLRSVGFQTPVCWYQCFNFASYLAIK